MKNGNRIAALFVLGSGIIATHLYHHHIFTARLTTDVLGFLLLYLSIQLFRRKRLALRISFWLISLLIASGLLHHQANWHIAVYLLTLLTLVGFQNSFTAKSQNLNMRRALVASGAVVIIALLYGIIGFYLIEKRAFGIDFTLVQSCKYAFIQLVSLTNVSPLPLTKHAQVFLDSLDWISITALGIAVANLFKPVRFALGPSQDKELATRIITEHSQSVEDFFKLWPEDKHYFFNTAKTSVLAYKVARASALVLDGPSGDPQTFNQLLKDFSAFCSQNDWTPAIIHADEHTKQIAHNAGFKSVFIGNEAMVNTKTFTTKTIASKHFRYIENKAKREELVVEVWEPPLRPEQVQSLKEISNAWLTTPGRREYTFVMGYFNDTYIGSSTVVVLKQRGRLLAYVNMIPSYIPGHASVDHMRFIPDMPAIGMHYLLKTAITDSYHKGIGTFNLGLSPLAGVDNLLDPGIHERLLLVVKRLGTRYYSFSGLEQFKNKFKPNWQPRFILYTKSPTNLIGIARSLGKAVEK